MTNSEDYDIGEVLSQLAEAGDGESVSFGDVLNNFGQRVFGPMLMVPAFLAVAPTGAIPGKSILTGSVIAVIAMQLLFMRSQPWLPSKLMEASISQDTLARSVERADPYAQRLDAYLRPRLTWLAKPPFQQIQAAICIVMAVSMFPLALLPFAVAIPGTAVLLIGIGLTTHDGYFTLSGLLLAALTLIPSIWVWGWIL